MPGYISNRDIGSFGQEAVRFNMFRVIEKISDGNSFIITAKTLILKSLAENANV